MIGKLIFLYGNQVILKEICPQIFYNKEGFSLTRYSDMLKGKDEILFVPIIHFTKAAQKKKFKVLGKTICSLRHLRHKYAF